MYSPSKNARIAIALISTWLTLNQTIVKANGRHCQEALLLPTKSELINVRLTETTIDISHNPNNRTNEEPPRRSFLDELHDKTISLGDRAAELALGIRMIARPRTSVDADRNSGLISIVAKYLQNTGIPVRQEGQSMLVLEPAMEIHPETSRHPLVRLAQFMTDWSNPCRIIFDPLRDFLGSYFVHYPSRDGIMAILVGNSALMLGREGYIDAALFHELWHVTQENRRRRGIIEGTWPRNRVLPGTAFMMESVLPRWLMTLGWPAEQAQRISASIHEQYFSADNYGFAIEETGAYHFESALIREILQALAYDSRLIQSLEMKNKLYTDFSLVLGRVARLVHAHFARAIETDANGVTLEAVDEENTRGITGVRISQLETQDGSSILLSTQDGASARRLADNRQEILRRLQEGLRQLISQPGQSLNR